MPRRDQPDLVAHVRHDQHLRGLSPTTAPVSKSYRPSQWRGSSSSLAGLQDLRSQSQRCARYRTLEIPGLTDAPTDYVAKYATRESADEAGEEDDDDDEMSSVGDFDSEDDDPAGDMEV